MEAFIFLGLGSNLGNRLENLKIAREKIACQIGQIVHASSLYQSKALGFKSESYFINQVIEIQSELNPFEILKITQEIERELGRLEKSTNPLDREKAKRLQNEIRQRDQHLLDEEGSYEVSSQCCNCSIM